MTASTTATPLAAARHPLQDWAQRVGAAPLRSVLGAGHLLLVTGAIAALCGSLVSIALIHIGTGLMALGAILSRPPIHRLPGFRLGCAFAGWVALSMVVGWIESGQKPKHLSVLHLWLLFPLGVAAFATAGARRWGHRSVAIAILTSVALALVQAFVGYDVDAGPLRIATERPTSFRVSGFLGHILIFASNLALLSFLYLTRDRWWIGALALLGVMLALAKTAFIGFAAGLAPLLWLQSGRARLMMPILIPALVFSTFAFSQLTDPRLKVRDDLEMSNGRTAIWSVSMEIARDQPLWGAGSARAWQASYAARTQVDQGEGRSRMVAQHAHNGPLILASTYGFPAALFFFGMLASILVQIRDKPRYRGALAIAAAWIIAGLFENLQVSTLGAACGWLALALSGAWAPSESEADQRPLDGLRPGHEGTPS